MIDCKQDMHGKTGMRRSLTRLCQEYAAYAGKKGLLAAALMALAALLESGGLLIVVPLLNVVFQTAKNEVGTTGRFQHVLRSGFAWLQIASPLGQLAILLLIFGILMTARALTGAGRDIVLTELRIGFVEAQRMRITARLSASSWDRIVALQHARITHMMSGDIQNLGQAVFCAIQCVVALSMLLAQGVLAVALAPILTVFTLAVLILGGVLLIPFLQRARNLGLYVTDANLNLLNLTAQFLGGLKLAISQNLQDRFVAEFRSALSALSQRQIVFSRQTAIKQVGVSSVTAVVGAALMLAGFGWFRVAPTLLMALLLIVMRMSGQFAQFQRSAQQLAGILPVFEKIKQLEDELSPSNAVPVDGAADFGDGVIALRDVAFSYRAGSSAEGCQGVQDVTLTLPSGIFVGICGPSGSGKSTLADLLVGLFPPQRGQIAIGGTALTPATVGSWRRAVSYVSQEPFLFYDTVRRNLHWMAPQADEARMWDALRFVGAEAVVRKMALGLDTIVGERGSLMSGGERQRIALARALLRQPRLLVLDEALSAVDVATELAIVSRLAAMPSRPTIVMITHRRESASFCDRILEMRDGLLSSS